MPMSARVIQRLSDWFLLDALGPTDYLWPTKPGGYRVKRRKPMGDTSFITWYRRGIEDAGVRYRNPHVTRHTFATRWLRRGGRLERSLGRWVMPRSARPPIYTRTSMCRTLLET